MTDLIFLQETHISTKSQADAFSRKWSGTCFWSFGHGRSSGVGLLVSPKFCGEIKRYIFDSDGRIFSVNIVNIYAPNTISERKGFFEQLHTFFLSPDRIIVGDFNCIDNCLERLNASDNSLPEKSMLRSFMHDFSLIDVWRKQNPRGICYTWSNANNTQASRLDRFLLSRFLFRGACSVNVLACPFSDHDFVVLDLSVDGLVRPRSSIWKFNTSLLSEKEFCKLLSSVIESQKGCVDDFATLGIWWDNLKLVVRNSCIDYCKQKHKSANRARNRLTNSLIRAKNLFALGDHSVASEIKNLESSLSSLALCEAEGAMIRSRAKWIEEGEKPTRFFFRLEEKRAKKNSFNSLFDSCGVEKTAQADIESIFVDFYNSLFTKDVLDMQVETELIDDLEFSLSDFECDSCEGEITKDELFLALKGLQTGKSPGSDGLPTEFYLAFWDDLGDILVLVLNENYHLGSLTDSQRESLLCLLYKKDDRRLPKNWRPISLLNTDYKLASKVITERLKPVMSTIVNADQTCGVVGRSIF